MTVKEILIDYLKENGFDGLCYEAHFCRGCRVDEINNCPEGCLPCDPAYRWDCDVCSDREKCEMDKEYGLCYRPEKQERKQKRRSEKMINILRSLSRNLFIAAVVESIGVGLQVILARVKADIPITFIFGVLFYVVSDFLLMETKSWRRGEKINEIL
jgi:hypothetical protein